MSIDRPTEPEFLSEAGDLMGALCQGTVPGLLGRLYAGRRSGHLHFVHGEERRSVSLRHGHIVNANTNVAADHMGEILVRQGVLSRADLDTASGIVAEEKKRLGLVLRELGLLDEHRLDDALARHTREVLGKVFSWSEGSYTFEEQADDTAEDEDLVDPFTAEMIIEAARHVDDPDVVRYALGDLDRVLVPTADPLLRHQRLTLTPAEGYILSRVDGTSSVREILTLIPLPPEETERNLLGLLATGMLECRPAPARAPRPLAGAPGPPRPVETPATPSPEPPAAAAGDPALEGWRREIVETWESLRTRNHFALLRIPRSATRGDVKHAYFALAKRFHPDVHQPGVADLKDKLSAILMRLGEAYETLSHPQLRAAYESRLPPGPVEGHGADAAGDPGAAPPGPVAPPSLDPVEEALLAEDALRRAERLLAEAKYWDAIQLLQACLPNVPGRVLRERGQILLARAYLKNPNWVRRGEELLQRIVQENPQNVDAHFTLGCLYEERGLKSRAETMFRKALELRPGHKEAAAHLKSAPPPALLKKLFGKP